MTGQRNGAQKMQFIAVLLFLAAFALVVLPPANADSAPPVTTLTAYFERNTLPVNDTVKFTVNCSAYSCGSGACEEGEAINTFGDVYSLSAICPSYGCFMVEYKYEDYASLTSCDLTGELNGEQFAILNSTHPFSCVLKNHNSRSCDLRVNISSAINTPAPAPAITPAPAFGNSVVVTMETPAGSNETKGPFDDILCFIKTLLGGTC